MIDSLNRVEISLQALEHNFLLLRELAHPAAILAMVKADGYGHGMVQCARLYSRLGVAGFGVAEAVEGVRLREAGLTEPILVLAGVVPETVEALLEFDLTPVLVDDVSLSSLVREAKRRGRRVGIHLKVDGGMGRQGWPLQQVPEFVRRLHGIPELRLEGLLVHFPKADDPASGTTQDILARFLDTCNHLPGTGSLVLHAANSGALIHFENCCLDMVRPGIALYGCYPSGRTGDLGRLAAPLQPAMRFVSRVIQVRAVDAGTGLGYGHTHIISRPARIALVPAGYANGYLRRLSNRAWALVRGERVPVVGRISMNLTMLDVTEVAGVQTGDEVVLLGSQGGETITPEELAGWMETIGYEVLCLLGTLNRRVYVQ